MTKLLLNTGVLGFHLGNDEVEIYIRLTHMKLLLIFKAKMLEYQQYHVVQCNFFPTQNWTFMTSYTFWCQFLGSLVGFVPSPLCLSHLCQLPHSPGLPPQAPLRPQLRMVTGSTRSCSVLLPPAFGYLSPWAWNATSCHCQFVLLQGPTQCLGSCPPPRKMTSG